jgi:dienelactone hydrolase
VTVRAGDQDPLVKPDGCGGVQAGEHITHANALTSRAAIGFHGPMPRGRSLAGILSLVSGVAFVAFLLASAWLGSLERGGPPHSDLTLEGGVPATLYLPPPASGDTASAFTEPPAPGERPPAVILAHGFSSDRTIVSALARRLAVSGFAVLTPDLRGHGENRNRFPVGRGRADFLAADFAAAVDFLRTTPLVDGSRIAVAGHSMGAGAALDFATRDSGLDAVLAISGGWSLLGPQRPPNVLLLVAASDPERVKTRTARLAEELAGDGQLAPGEMRGDFRQGTALRRIEIPGTSHGTIIWSDAALAEAVAWLDAAFQREPAGAPAPPDPRGRLAVLLAVLTALVLPGLGLLIGGLTPTTEHLPDTRRWIGLLLLAAALLAAMPLASLGSPGAALSIEVGDVIVVHFALAGIALLVVLYLRDRARFASLFAAPGRSLLGAGLGAVAVFFLLQPVSVYVHRFSLTPERTVVFAVAALGFFPLALAMQALVRRGSPLSAGLYSIAARALILLMLVAGVQAGVMAPVVMLMVPGFAVVFLLVEILASSFYLASRNLLAIGLIDAAWLGLLVAATMPIRL